ncbi:MAG: M15 family metallopeptidase [Bacteroidia bacterium]|nr:M15 family metallopeptidase [Bacteroidia bacterium]MBT8268580.1 M15 family metallopeptidase [Bacteroidia bacterium]NNF81734.1 M15 family metallopeptidase [Flavobacteriaceae bacterium]NNK69615.1 M15 family metallopeptidase [Flavobacteriaceae bacterium]
MKRRRFISNTICGSLAFSFAPFSMFSLSQDIDPNELIGKGSPELVGTEIKFRKEVYDAYFSMREDAKKAGILITAVSAYRSFERQKQIWERKYNRYLSQGLQPRDSIKKIIEYSTIPGTSRHHWGTDIDIVDGYHMDVPHLLAPSNFNEGKPFYKLGQWLGQHATEYGFYRTYTEDPLRKGFKPEPWHYSYKPLSVKFLENFLKIDLLKVLKAENFQGSDHFTPTWIETYRNEHILDINPELLP